MTSALGGLTSPAVDLQQQLQQLQQQQSLQSLNPLLFFQQGQMNPNLQQLQAQILLQNQVKIESK